jgi:anti-anti-sigma factor
MKSDSTMYGAAHRDESADVPMLVRLDGEFDVLYQKTLADILVDSLASGKPTLVDLSGVTFMDSRCLLELAVYYQLGKGRVALCDPSHEVMLSVAACDLEDWVDFVYSTERERSGRRHPGERLLQSCDEVEEGNLYAHTAHGGKE